MSAHDDYFDLDAAWKEYDRAYVLWSQAVDGNESNGWKLAPERLCIRRSNRLVRALFRLSYAAKRTLKNHWRRGWPSPPRLHE